MAREGYANRLQAVRHLFEAEDESQCPGLHVAIRDGRTRYQAVGEQMLHRQTMEGLLRQCWTISPPAPTRSK